MHVKPILVGILAITFFSLATASGQLEEILTKFSTFTNEEYGIQLEYPSEWKIFEDRVSGDYVIDIAVFVPSSEIIILKSMIHTKILKQWIRGF